MQQSQSELKKKLFIKFQYCVPQHKLSSIIGKASSSKNFVVRTIMIQAFKAKYNVDLSIASQPNSFKYKSFNDFFTRSLKNNVRIIDESNESIVSPVDGNISQIGAINESNIIQAKDHIFSVESLIGNLERAKPFKNGNFTTLYLAPSDYHRVHMPFSGILTETIYIPGELFSVNPLTAENVPKLFARNERMVCLFDTELGRMAIVLVGAMIVAGIETVVTGKITPTGQLEFQKHHVKLEKGDELGRFYLGSTVILIFEKDKLAWEKYFNSGDAIVVGKKLGCCI